MARRPGSHLCAAEVRDGDRRLLPAVGEAEAVARDLGPADAVAARLALGPPIRSEALCVYVLAQACMNTRQSRMCYGDTWSPCMQLLAWETAADEQRSCYSGLGRPIMWHAYLAVCPR